MTSTLSRRAVIAGICTLVSQSVLAQESFILEMGEPQVLHQEYLNEQIPLTKLVKQFAKKNPNFHRSIVVDKSDRLVTVFADGTALKKYGASLGASPYGRKIRRGDHKTPEGTFYVAQKVPNSSFYKALLISYPDKAAASIGFDKGLIGSKQYRDIHKDISSCRVPDQNTRLGSMIELHGGGGGPGYFDWTDGCIALNDKAMQELYDFAQVGCFKNGTYKTSITIKK